MDNKTVYTIPVRISKDEKIEQHKKNYSKLIFFIKHLDYNFLFMKKEILVFFTRIPLSRYEKAALFLSTLTSVCDF
jgi:hypothetical protein